MDEALSTRTSLRNTEPAGVERVEQDSLFDRDSGDELGPEWCVDLGLELRAMNKFELWLALGTGDVAADARVWRVGRECWQPACDIPDLACALKLHAQVLMAAVKAAESSGDEERVTLVPGELPSFEGGGVREPLRKSNASMLDASNDVFEEVQAHEIEVVGTLENGAAAYPACSYLGGAPAGEAAQTICAQSPAEICAADICLGELTPSSESYHCNSETDESVMHLTNDSEPIDVEAKSVTPGPAVVDGPVIRDSVIRARRGLPRKKELSAWSGIAALGALAATSLFTLPRVFASPEESPTVSVDQAAGQVEPDQAIAQIVPHQLASDESAAKPGPANLLPAENHEEIAGSQFGASASDAAPRPGTEPNPVAAAAVDVPRGPKDPTVSGRNSRGSKPSKHHVRPTSVSPSHRGQGRSRQRSR